MLFCVNASACRFSSRGKVRSSGMNSPTTNASESRLVALSSSFLPSRNLYASTPSRESRIASRASESSTLTVGGIPVVAEKNFSVSLPTFNVVSPSPKIAR